MFDDYGLVFVCTCFQCLLSELFSGTSPLDHEPDAIMIQANASDKFCKLKTVGGSITYKSSNSQVSSIKLHKDTIGPNAGRYPDPFQVPGYAEPFKLFENVRQRAILTAVVRFLKTHVSWEATDQSTPQPVFRALCCGVAGTGKTFIMQFIRIFTNIVLDHNDVTKVLGPTGLSIGNCNGSTVDRALKACDSCMQCIAHPTP